MEYQKQGKKDGPDRRLPVLATALLAGALAGSLLYPRWKGLQTLLSAWGQAPPDLWQALWPDLALLCALFACGLLRQGCLISLLLFAVKGFSLSALSAACLAGQGSAGYVQALCRALLPGFFALAALLLLGRQAMALSLLRQRCRKPIAPDSAYLFTFGICLALTLLSAALTVWLSPKLWAAAQTFFP